MAKQKGSVIQGISQLKEGGYKCNFCKQRHPDLSSAQNCLNLHLEGQRAKLPETGAVYTTSKWGDRIYLGEAGYTHGGRLNLLWLLMGRKSFWRVALIGTKDDLSRVKPARYVEFSEFTGNFPFIRIVYNLYTHDIKEVGRSFTLGKETYLELQLSEHEVVWVKLSLFAEPLPPHVYVPDRTYGVNLGSGVKRCMVILDQLEWPTVESGTRFPTYRVEVDGGIKMAIAESMVMDI